MKHAGYFALGTALSLLVFIGYSNFERTGEAQKIARQSWDYATVNFVYAFNPATYRSGKIYGMTEVCYVQADGCRRVEIKHELDYGTFLQQTRADDTPAARAAASRRAAEIAFQKTLARLGDEGFELVAEPQLDTVFVEIDDYNRTDNKADLFTRPATKAVYLKRLRTQ